MKKVSFTSSDGLKLVGIVDEPKNSNGKAIILAHGITVDKEEEGIFTELSRLLSENEFTVLRFDFRGHGESEGKSVDMTIAGELNDLEAAISEVESKGYKEIGLLGASFGGGIAALYVSKNQNRTKALCLWNPCLNYDHCFLNPVTPWIRSRKAHMRKDFEEKGWTTLGSRNFVIGKQLFDEMENVFPYESLKNITIPTVIVHGTNDTYVPYEDSTSYVKNLQRGELISLEDAEHGFQDVREYRNKANQETLKFFKQNL